MSVKKLTVVASLVFWPAVAMGQPQDAQSRYRPTGPPPEEGYQPYDEAVRTRGQKVIAGVPGYSWRHGCGPTAAGMVIGYWDGLGYDQLIPGNASTQTAAVNQAITSGDPSWLDNCSNPGVGHFEDYSCPKDTPPTLLLDKSSTGGAHASDCLGDFMQTSWSARSNYYGWAWFSDMDDSLLGYVGYVNATYAESYQATSYNEYLGTFTWTKYVAEINADRPMVFLVDTDADGDTDHFVTAIGYRDTQGYNEYACLDTWAPPANVRWERFRALSTSYTWGIYGATYFRLSGDDMDVKWSQLPHGPYEGFDEPSNFWWAEIQTQANSGAVDGPDDGVDSTRDLPKAQMSLATGKVPESATQGEIRVVQAIPRDGSASVAVEGSRQGTLVYENVVNPVEWYFAPVDAGFTLVADDMTLAGSERKLVRYDFYVYSSAQYWSVGSELYTDANGYPGTPIPGTSFGLGFMNSGYETIAYTPSTDVILPDKVWLVLEFWEDYAGWVVADEAELGYTDDVMALYDGQTWGLYGLTESYAGFWAHIECEGVNKVVADDFQSDGRPIDGLRWWGSYFDDLYSPWYYDPPYTMDGWFISFHHDEVTYSGCPPDVLIDGHPTALGIYYCPVGAVEWEELYPDCFESHLVWKYAVDLSDCCLLCSEQDPRTGHYPATADEFREEAELWYWLDIQAVTGVTWYPPYCDYQDRVLTGHLPPDWTTDWDFWGWHTSPEHNRYEACTGRIYDLTRYPPDCWDYDNWHSTSWKCPPPVELVDMAFELLTPSSSCPTTDPPTKPPGEAGYDKVRYISMEPGNPGQQTALRVTLTTLPPPFSGLNDTKCWVSEPQQVSENSGNVNPIPDWPDFMSANLQGTPLCMDWSTVGILHVTDDDIVPASQLPGGVFNPAIYDVQAIDCECDFNNEANYSAPLTITTSKWGDLVGTCAVIPCTPPDRVVNITTDVTASLDKFKNLPNAVLKSRADIEPNLPDWLVNISDITYVLDAFRGFAYPPAQTPPSLAWPTGPDGCP